MELTFTKTNRFVEAARRLLSGRYVIRARNPKGFQVITDNARQLSDYFELAGAELKVNETLGVAYLTSIHEDDDSSQIRFGKKITLTPTETLALIFMRKLRTEYFDSPTAEAESPLLDVEKIKEAMRAVLRYDNDRDFQKIFEKTIDRFKDLQFLIGQEIDSLAITPVVDIALPADQVQTLLIAAQKFFIAKESQEA